MSGIGWGEPGGVGKSPRSTLSHEIGREDMPLGSVGMNCVSPLDLGMNGEAVRENALIAEIARDRETLAVGIRRKAKILWWHKILRWSVASTDV